MGFKTEINWVLKVNDRLEPLKEGDVREFTKEGARVYPVNMPVFLVDKEWNVQGYAIISKSEVGISSTKIVAKIGKLFSKSEKDNLTKIFRQMYAA